MGEPSTTLSVIIFFVFILLSALTVMNMLIGVLCEVVSQVAATEKEEAAITLMKETILGMLKQYDTNGRFMIGRDEMEEVLTEPMTQGVLLGLEVDVEYLQDLQP